MGFFKRLKIKRLIKKLGTLKQAREHNQPTDEVIRTEKAGYHQLADIYAALQYKKKWPFARERMLACYRSAAMLHDAKAQYLLGKALLDQAKMREELETGHVFASQSNERNMKQLYEEAHAYLSAAEGLQHVEARRLHGLCFINAWGVPEDKEQGFKRVVESIELEKSWDKVPQIFASIGLNKPEFFSALTKMRQGE
jgi:TPR repeat protein